MRVGDAVGFDGSASTDNVGVVNWTWSIEHEGGTKTLYGRTIEFLFQGPGLYLVTLRVRDAAGLEATNTIAVVVEEVPGSWDLGSTILAISVMVAVAVAVAALVLWRRRKG